MNNKTKKFMGYLSGQMTDQEMANFQAELAASPTLEKEYSNFSDGFNAHFLQGYYKELLASNNIKKPVTATETALKKDIELNTKKEFTLKILSIGWSPRFAYAASFLILVVASFWIYSWVKAKQKQELIYAQLDVVPPLTLSGFNIEQKDNIVKTIDQLTLEKIGIMDFNRGLRSKNLSDSKSFFISAKAKLEQYLANPTNSKENYRLYHFAGRAAFETEDYDGAIANYTKGKALHIQPDDDPYWKIFYDYQIALVLLHKGECEKAVTILKKIFNEPLDSDYLELKLKLGQNLSKINCQ